MKVVVQSNANKLVLNNYLNVDGVGQMLIDKSVELRGVDLLQSQADDASLHSNLVLQMLRADTSVHCATADIR